MSDVTTTRQATSSLIPIASAILGFATVLVGIAMAFADLKAHRDYTREQVSKLETRLDRSEAQNRLLAESLARMEGNILYIRQTLERQSSSR